MAARNHKTANIWVARIIPIILIGLIAYSAYVITRVITIDYLINPPADFFVQRRPGAATAILFFYYLLLIPTLVCYARLLYVITTNPGYVPRGATWYQQRKEKATDNLRKSGHGHHSRRASAVNKTEKSLYQPPSRPANAQNLESGGSPQGSSLATPTKHKSASSSSASFSYSSGHVNNATEIPFWQRDIFVCNPDGRPTFCSSCLNHKPDRTHHCSEVDRCVLKMDHFCPWVGGIVSETSFKYFIQFLVYAAFFCIMVLTTMAVFIAERRRIDPAFLNVHYFLILALSALFVLFSVGMAGSSIQLAFVNSTTVENLTRRSKVWFLAVLIPRTEDGRLPTPPPQGITGPRFQTITYPRPAEEEQFLIHQARSQLDTQGYGPSTLPPFSNTTTTTPPTSPQPSRTFAILSTKPGENPFDLGPWQNIRQVMGHRVSDWLLPIKPSPCAHHSSRVSAFPMNEALLACMREDAGLLIDDGRRAKGSRGGTGASGSGASSGHGDGDGDGDGVSAEEDDENMCEEKRRRRRRSRKRRRESSTRTVTARR
jgi:palmitoyltransferase